MYVCAWCVCLVPRSVSAHGVEKRALDQLERELQVIVPPEWVMGTELRSSTRPRALNHETIYPAPKLWVDFFLSLLIFLRKSYKVFEPYYHPPQSPLRSSPSSPHPTCVLFSFSSGCQSDLWNLYSAGCVAIHQSMADLPGPTLLWAPVNCTSSSARSGTLCPPLFFMLWFFFLAWYCIVLVHAAPTAVSSSYVQGSYCVQIHFLMNVIKL